MDKQKILELLGDVTGEKAEELMKLPLDTRLLNIGIDSIRFIQFIVALEEEFSIEVLDSDLLLSNFETLDMMYSTLSKYFNKEVPVKKVLICDCDNVLWHGVAGEENIYVDKRVLAFHGAITELYDRGVLICLCSKNDGESIEGAFNAIDTPLKAEHFVLAKVSFKDKVTSIREIEDELGLSADSFVFTDDSDYEIGLVSSMLPEVTSVKADYNDMTFIDRIAELFADSPADGPNRTKQYKEQKLREKEKIHYNSVEEYNASLETSVVCDVADMSHACRIAELSRRTNRFNLSGARYSEDDVKRFIQSGDCMVYYIEASDKYGDMGIVGAAVADKKNSVISDFFLSCRVFSRGFEELLLERIREDFSGTLYGVYKEFDKNRQFSDFYAKNGVLLYE